MLAVAILGIGMAHAKETAKVFFDLPEGEARPMLRQFAVQAHREILFPVESVEGVRTRAVHGRMTPQEAIDRMLAGTGLAVVVDHGSGAFAVVVRRSDHAKAALPTPGETQGTQTITQNETMAPIKRNKNPLVLLAGWLGMLASPADAQPAPTPTPPAAVEEEEEEVVVLSPFVVDESKDVGYRANSTLAGSRLDTKLSDLAGSISVVTGEMMRDMASTDFSNVLQYTMGMEVGGWMGNFSDGLGDTSGARLQPNNRQRSRGLVNADQTRNFFRTRIPFDAYNSGRLTISRGPNAVLFGLGTAGGIIDASLVSGSRVNDSGEVGVAVTDTGGYRGTINLNKVLFDGRLGVRLAALHERREYIQKPSYEDGDRFYAAVDALLREGDEGFLGETVLLGNYEKGFIKSNRPVTILPISFLRQWFEPVDPARYSPYGITVPARLTAPTFVPKYTYDNRTYQGDSSLPSVADWNWHGNTVRTFFESDGSLVTFPGNTNAQQGDIAAAGERQRYQRWYAFEYNPGAPFEIRQGRDLPYSVWDTRKKQLVTNSLEAEQDFSAWNATLRQSFWNNAGGLEYSYDRQQYRVGRQETLDNTIIGGITVDINQYLLNQDGTYTANPNVGRPMATAHVLPERQDFYNNEAHRLTAYYQLDASKSDGWLRHLGRHRLTGIFSREEFETNTYRYNWLWWDGPDAGRIWTTSGTPPQPLPFDDFSRRVSAAVYVGPDLRGLSSPGEIRLNQATVPMINEGFVVNSLAWDRVNSRIINTQLTTRKSVQGDGVSLEEIDSQVLAWQGHLLGDHLVGLIGWRNDEFSRFGRKGSRLVVPGGSTVVQDDWFTLAETPSLVNEGETWTYNVVGYLPDRWNPLREHVGVSAHWGVSENFTPGGLRTNILGEQILPQGGETEEYGLTFYMLRDRLSMRFNRFVTSLARQNSIGSGGTNNFGTVIGGQLSAVLAAQNNNVAFERLYDYAFQHTGGARRYNNYQEFYNAIIDVCPPFWKEKANYRVQNGVIISDPVTELNISDTRNVKAEGYELELSGEITRGWSVSVNIINTTAVISDVLPTWGPAMDESQAKMVSSGLWDMYTNGWDVLYTPTAPLPTPQVKGMQNSFFSQVYNNVINGRTSEGQNTDELREWRANLITNYAFSPGSALKGWAVGGSLRWEDEIILGYAKVRNPTTGFWQPDLSRPYTGPTELNGDIWVSYERKLTDSVRWRVQLNVRNIIGDSDPIPARTQPDGIFDAYRIPPMREIVLTNTFAF